MSRKNADRVQLSITLDEVLARWLQKQAAKRSVSLADYVEEIVRSATSPARVATAVKPESRDQSDAVAPESDDARQLPRSVGVAEVDFDARDTDAWLEVHWGRE